MSFATAYISGWGELTKVVEQIVKEHGHDGFTEEKTKSQFYVFGQTLGSIESFLMSNWDVNGEIAEEDIIHLAEETLAYVAFLSICPVIFPIGCRDSASMGRTVRHTLSLPLEGYTSG